MIPAGIILIFNVIVYVMVTVLFIRKNCTKQPEMTERMKRKAKSRRQTIIQLLFSSPTIAIFFLFAWLFVALTFVTSEASLGFHLLSALFIALLGWFIFIYYIVTAKDTRKLVHDALCGKDRKNLNTNQFISMESLGRASGIDESDSDSDYPERERKYGEFDVTYIGQKSALIEQKFTIRFKADGDGDDTTNGATHTQPENPPPAEDTAPSTSPGVPGSPEISNRTRLDSICKEDLAAILEDPKAQFQSRENSDSLSESPHISEEDVDTSEYPLAITDKSLLSTEEPPLPSSEQVVTATFET